MTTCYVYEIYGYSLVNALGFSSRRLSFVVVFPASPNILVALIRLLHGSNNGVLNQQATRKKLFDKAA